MLGVCYLTLTVIWQSLWWTAKNADAINITYFTTFEGNNIAIFTNLYRFSVKLNVWKSPMQSRKAAQFLVLFNMLYYLEVNKNLLIILSKCLLKKAELFVCINGFAFLNCRSGSHRLDRMVKMIAYYNGGNNFIIIFF